MSPDELLWKAPQLGGLDAEQWVAVVDHLLHQLAEFLRMDLRRDDDAAIHAGKSFGFSVHFWSPHAIARPLDLNVRGTFGASIYEDRYMAVQGWLYAYLLGQRLATIANGHNHIFLRYAKTDADDDDWDMAGCTGSSAWRSLGWSPDTYDEFDGLDVWQDPPDG
jgi:hypothetical protein